MQVRVDGSYRCIVTGIRLWVSVLLNCNETFSSQGCSVYGISRNNKNTPYTLASYQLALQVVFIIFCIHADVMYADLCNKIIYQDYLKIKSKKKVDKFMRTLLLSEHIFSLFSCSLNTFLCICLFVG